MTAPDKKRLAVWLLALVLLGMAAALRVEPSAPVQTDLLALLPADRQAPLVDAAVERNREDFSRRLLLLVSGPSDRPLGTFASQLLATLRAHGLSSDSATAQSDLLDFYRRHRYALAGNSGVPASPASLAAQTAANLGTPGSLPFSPVDDPAGTLTRFLGSLPQPYPGFSADGAGYRREHDKRIEILLPLHSDASGFGEAGPREAVRGLAAARKQLAERCPACTLTATGAPLFAAAAQREGRREVAWLSGASLLLIAVLLIGVFRAFRPVLLAALCLGSSVFAGTALVIVAAGSVHLLTLVCGTTLLGISIDYAFHYLAERRYGESDESRDTLRVIRPGLQLGLATSLLGFAFLLGAGFPALTQIALFSGGGLLAAYLTVELLFPALTGPPARRRPGRLAGLRPAGRWRWLIPVCLLLATGPGLWQLQSNDDIRELQNFPQQLLQNDRTVRQAIGQTHLPGFFLSRGDSLSDALAREYRLAPEVPGLVGLSRFLPSAATQRANLDAWNRALDDPQALQQAFRRYGLPAALAKRIRDAWQTADRTPFGPDELLAAGSDLDRFVVRTDQATGLLSLPGDSGMKPDRLRRIGEGHANVGFVMPVQRVNATFGEIRHHAMLWVGIGYLLIAGLLWRRYGWRGAVRVMLAPVVAVLCALGLLGWLNVPVNVFVVMALILVLGIGVDYTIFLRETRSHAGAATRIAVMLSAFTTVSAFGLLTLSRIPALHAFGLTILIGIVVAFLTSPLAVKEGE